MQLNHHEGKTTNESWEKFKCYSEKFRAHQQNTEKPKDLYKNVVKCFGVTDVINKNDARKIN